MSTKLHLTNDKTSRVYWIDQLRAIAFFFVLVGHVSTYKILGRAIGAFHMPLFFIITGYTLSIDKMYEMSFKELVIRRTKSMLIPYLWLSFLSLPIWVVNWKILGHLDVGLTELIKGIFVWQNIIYETPSNPMWFIGALFVAYIYFWIAVKISKKDTLKFIAINIIYFIIGYFSRSLNLPWHINTAFIGVTFISIGMFMKKFVTQHFKIELIRKNKLSYILLILFIGLIGLYAALNNGVNVMVYGAYNNIILFYASSIFVSLFLSIICYHLPHMKFISFVGQNTLLYLAFHIGLIRFVQNLYPASMQNYNFGLFQAVLFFFVLAFISWIINTYFPYVHGKKIIHRTKLTQLCKFLCVLWCGVIPTYILIKKILPDMMIFDHIVLFITCVLCLAVLVYFILDRYLKVFFLEDTK